MPNQKEMPKVVNKPTVAKTTDHPKGNDPKMVKSSSPGSMKKKM